MTVQESKPLEETVRLVNMREEVIGIYRKAPQVSAAVKKALERVVELRQEHTQTQDHRKQLEQRVSEIAKDQARIRENMSRLNKQSQLYARYVKKLNAQESDLESIQQQIDGLHR